MTRTFKISEGTFTGLRSRAAARPWSFVGDNVVQLSGFDPATFEVIVGDVHILIPLLLNTPLPARYGACTKTMTHSDMLVSSLVAS